MTYNTESVDGIFCGVAPRPTENDEFREFMENARSAGVGAFYFSHDHKTLCAKLPGSHSFSRWAIHPHQIREQSWDWNRDEEKPTLHPSLNFVGVWHGWLRQGRFVSC